MMEANLKGCLKAIVLELRRQLEGYYDAQGNWQAGDLERRLAAIGVRRDRPPVPADELLHLSPEDRDARRVVDAFLEAREEAEVERGEAITEFVAKSAYTWANRLLALRCMEARGLIDEVVLQKEVYGGRSLQHNRLARRAPERCAGEDEGLFALLFDEFDRRANELPLLFNPKAPEVALRPSVAVIKRCIALLSGTEVVKGQAAVTDDIFMAPDALGWAYQYWNTEEKDRVFEKVRTKKGAKIEGADEIVAATCIYTEPYIAKFLIQNSLGALWAGMYPESRLHEKWEYFVRDADRVPIQRKPVREITLLDPSTGSGHFLLEAFSLLYDMYQEEGQIADPAEICASILEHNIYGIDIDERAVQIAALALVMKAKEKAANFIPRRLNLVATNIRIPSAKEHLEEFLRKHPEDAQLKPALLTIFEGLSHADELGSLLQIEAPVERELKSIQGKLSGQLTLTGPKTDKDWQAWKTGVIVRLREHFDAQAQDPDLTAAFFGEAASKGLSLVDLLTRRYDVVAANPPYMGFRKFEARFLNWVKALYPDTYVDLYTSFTQRACELITPSGCAALVTLNTWLSLDGFSETREHVFGSALIDVAVMLGTGTFPELSNTNAMGFCMFVLNKGQDRSKYSTFFDTSLSSEKEATLALLLKTRTCIRRRHLDFEHLPGKPIAYAAPEPILRAFRENEPFRMHARAKQGLKTGDNDRFIRFVWECPQNAWRIRWFPCTRGGPYRRWRGNFYCAADWESDGIRVRNFKRPDGKLRSRPQNIDVYFREGITWTTQTSYGFSARKVDAGLVIESAGPLAIPNNPNELNSLLGILNCRVIDFLFNLLQPNVGFGEGYLEKLPFPRLRDDFLFDIGRLAAACVELARADERQELISAYCDPIFQKYTSLASLAADLILTQMRRNAIRHELEGCIEQTVLPSFALSKEDVTTVYKRVGRPVAWLPLIDRYDAWENWLIHIAGLQANIVPGGGESRRRTLTEFEAKGLKKKLRTVFFEGANAATENLNDEEVSDIDTYENDRASAETVVPTETFVEKLAMLLETHPISIVRLIEEGREQEGWRCPREEKRVVENYLTWTVLRLLGHRWPRQIDSAEPLPAWADPDGIVPLTEGAEEPTLLERMRERISEDFGPLRVNAIEQEFEGIVGKPLSAWLVTEFFPRHVSQFKKRPIAWQIESSPNNGKRRGRGKASAPAFSCLVYYHRVDVDLLPKLRSQYVGPLRARFQTELGGLERLDKRTADQDERRVQLEMLLDELKDFDARLEQVITNGFASPVLDGIAAKEPLDRWTSRDGETPNPTTPEAFLSQERRYDPDINDGVRVNIAPLQKAGLLVTNVLAAKDVEKATSDRAEWRVDERCWCREGKLPQPGWWPSREAKKLAIPSMPDTIPTLEPLAETSLMICAFVHASHGTIGRLDLARAFSLRSQPAVLLQLAPENLRSFAEKWANRVGTRTVPPGLLATALSGLAERDGIRLTMDAASRSIVTKSKHTPSESDIDPWFRFEARLALGVLAALEPKDVTQVDAGIVGEDRKLLATGTA